MRIDSSTLLFFDAACLIAAAGSPSGGSGFLLSTCSRGLLQGAVSQPVLLEAERNVLAKLGSEALERYHRILAATPLSLVPVPSEIRLKRFSRLVGKKDAHVLGAALAANSPFLLTLDKRLAERVTHSDLPALAISPGDFIRTVLPRHIDYLSVRG